MSTSLLSIGMTGLNAAQAGILTTGNNIANASTPNYNREQIVQTTAIPNLTGGGFIGQGTNVQTVTRSYSQYLNTQLLSAQSGASSLTSYGAQIAQIDNMLADPTAGLSPALANFFQGVQQASANPASIPSRQAMLSNAQSLVASFQSINQTLQGIRDGTNTQIGGEVTLINSYATQLAAVNQQIVLAQAGSNQPANSLLDQRDQLISNLNKEIGVTTSVQSDGTYNVFIGNGQPLVVGSQASTLTTTQDPNDPQKTAVAFQVPGGTRAILSDSLLTGGTLGGLVGFRDNSLDSAQNQLGLIAIGLATSFNAQSQLGQDLNGKLGGQFFSVSQPAVFSSSANSDYTTNPSPVSATISDVSKLTASDYRLSANGGGLYTLLNLSDNTTVASGLTVDSNGNLTDASQTPPVTAFDGLTIKVSSTPAPATGDSFLIQPTRTGAANIAVTLTDPAAIALATPISTAAAQANSGTATISPGVVSATASTLAAAFNITYQSASPAGFTGFPVGSTVSVGPAGSATNTTITSSSTVVPYTAGANISVDGVGVNITGTPSNGDSFTIAPPPTAPTAYVNGGLTAMFGTPAAATTQGAAIGSAAPTLPLTVTIGSNDQLNIALDGGSATPITLAAGTYTTSAALLAAINSAITTAGLAAKASADPITGKLMVTSNTVGGATAVALTEGNGAMSALFGSPISGPRGEVSGGSPPASPLTVTAGVNDKFTVKLDGGTAVWVTIPPGSYATPAALATQLQTSINAAAAPASATVSINGSNELVVASNTVGGASAVALGNIDLGTGAITSGTATSTSSLPAAPITLSYNKTSNTLSGFPVGAVVTVNGTSTTIASTSTQVPYTSGATIRFNGISFAISGAPNSGDTFTVGPNANGVSDSRNGLLLGQLQTAKILESTGSGGPTASLQDAYSQIVSEVGNKAREVQVTGAAQTSLATQAQTARDSFSAVNLDEEAANLIQYQQAYQASAKMITIAGKLFDSILGI